MSGQSGTSTSSTSAMQETDVTHCSICLETFKEPKALPCLHTFCRTCLEQHCAGKAQRVSCPLCREPFVVPRGGVTNLRNNFFIDQLKQLQQSKDDSQNKRSSNSNFCKLCSVRESEITCYCIECDQHICDECSASHTKIQVSHRVVPRYNEAYMQHSKKKIKLSVNYCELHPSEPNRLYCYDCKMLTCHLCFVSKHMKHNLIDVDEAAEIFRQQLKRDVDNVSIYPLKEFEKLKQLEYEANLFMKKIATTESKISQKYDQLISLILYHKNELMEELNVFKNKILKEVETVKDEIETQSMIRDSFKAHILELMDAGTACEISGTAHDIHARAEELVKTQGEHDCLKLSEVEITFKPSLPTTDNVKNFIGELVLRGNLQRVPAGIGSQKSEVLRHSEVSLRSQRFSDTQKLDLTKLPRNLKVRHVMPGTGQAVSGIAVLRGEVFIVRQTSQVDVYKSDDFTLIRNLTITGSTVLSDLVSCSHFNCLYAVDPEQRYIYRYDLRNNAITGWSVDEPCHKLSVTKRYSILATTYVTKRIQLYTTHGSLLREISLDSSIDRPWHSVQLPTGNFIVCHVGTQQHRVCIVNQSGCVIQSYGGPRGEGVGQLSNPFHLAVDVHDNVLVADHSNGRVQWLSRPTLTYLSVVVIHGHQLNQPNTLYFDERNRRLYIGDGTGGRMFVLDVQY